VLPVSLFVKPPSPLTLQWEIFVTVLVGKVEVSYRVNHLKVNCVCNPNSLTRKRRRNVRTLITEKNNFNLWLRGHVWQINISDGLELITR
jgi:hypothetical protein